MENDCRHFYFWLRMNKKNLELRNRVCLRFKGPSQIKTSICITKKFLSEFAKIIILQVIVFIDFLRVAICLYVVSSSMVCISIIITQLHVTIHFRPLCAASMYFLYTAKKVEKQLKKRFRPAKHTTHVDSSWSHVVVV